MILIDLINVGKKYLNRKISFKVYKNDFIIITGENGTGKSTILKIISGYIKSDYGLCVRGNLKISYMEEIFDLPDMKVIDYLKIMEDIKKGRYNDLLAEAFEIPLQQYTSKLSKGNKQKLGIVVNLIGDSDINIFDEPLNGLDKVSIKVFTDYLKSKKNSRTFIINTHYPGVFKEFCNKHISL
ncbi:ATP-binding cassette domain-containing protein [Haploplasma axanthum]|nr:ATP-binding cassette domain-containing protein [Haploplasma axanthum]